MNAKELAEKVSGIIKEHVSAALTPLTDRLAALETKRLSDEDINALIAQSVAKALAGLKKPKDGEPGRDGRDGRDALEIDIRPDIDLQRSYPRGSFAFHDGGLWVSRKRTEGMEGWELLVDGLKELRVEKTGDRSFELVVVKSSGQDQKMSLALPAMIYRGIYKHGQEYEQGDTVTQSGSLWHCNADKTKESPGESKHWTLATKRGKDGKDFTPGAPVRLGKA